MSEMRATSCQSGPRNFRQPSLTLIELFRLLFQKLTVLEFSHFVYRENMKSGDPLVTFYVLHNPNMTLIGKVLTDPSSSVPDEAMCVPKSGKRSWRFRQVRRLSSHHSVEEVVERALRVRVSVHCHRQST
jgi:hypothetical protein